MGNDPGMICGEKHAGAGGVSLAIVAMPFLHTGRNGAIKDDWLSSRSCRWPTACIRWPGPAARVCSTGGCMPA
jgi:hypothetical protein